MGVHVGMHVFLAAHVMGLGSGSVGCCVSSLGWNMFCVFLFPGRIRGGDGLNCVT